MTAVQLRMAEGKLSRKGVGTLSVLLKHGPHMSKELYIVRPYFECDLLPSHQLDTLFCSHTLTRELQTFWCLLQRVLNQR